MYIILFRYPRKVSAYRTSSIPTTHTRRHFTADVDKSFIYSNLISTKKRLIMIKWHRKTILFDKYWYD